MALHVTQCPSCESTFNTSARVLNAAHGLVRCGACLSVFEADQHFVGGLSTASNDEAERLTPESVFISAPGDYFDPTRFLEHSDLQDYEEPASEPEGAAETAHEDEVAPLAGSDWQPAERPSTQAGKSSDHVSESSFDSETDLAADVSAAADPGSRPATAARPVADMDIDFGGASQDDGQPFASDEKRDSDFDVFDSTPQTQIPEDKPEEVHDSTFDVYRSDEPEEDWTPQQQIEVQDSSFDIYGGVYLDVSESPHPAIDDVNTGNLSIETPPGMDPATGVVILPELPEDSETLSVVREVLGEEDPGEDFPMEADADAWYLQEDPEAETHFQRGIDSGEIVILPEGQSEATEPQPAASSTAFDADLETGNVVIMPQGRNVSAAAVDIQEDRSVADTPEPEAALAQPLEQDQFSDGSEAQPVPDSRTATLVESELKPAQNLAPTPVSEPDLEPEPVEQADAEDTPETLPMVENDHDAEDDAEPSGDSGQRGAKEALRARLSSTDLAEGDDNRLSPENLQAVRGMDDTLELEERRVGRRVLRALAGTLLLIVVLTGILAVVAWQRMPVLSLDPNLRPAYLTACNLLGCELPVYRDTGQIETENLVVRSHPSLPDTLEMTTIFSNLARFEQPFPVIELQFRDINNRLVESREFMPTEYLPPALRGVTNMPVRSPVQITLQLPDPGASAVNYQLNYRAGISQP